MNLRTTELWYLFGVLSLRKTNILPLVVLQQTINWHLTRRRRVILRMMGQVDRLLKQGMGGCNQILEALFGSGSVALL